MELFDELYEKVYEAETQNQKEKHEMELKKEIKKLQRLRDQVKTWLGNNDVRAAAAARAGECEPKANTPRRADQG